MLFAVCCIIIDVRCLSLFVVWCVLSAVIRELFFLIVCCSLFADGCLLFVVSCAFSE